MTRPIRTSYNPPTIPKVEQTRCSRACCWTPFGHTPRQGCTCHTGGTR